MECQVSKGIINYEVCGEGSPIIVLHMMGTDHRSMKSWLEPIFIERNEWKRIYVDIPAHGKSAITDQVKGTDDMLDMIMEFIDTVLPNQMFSVIGASFGGYLAQGIIHKRSESIKGICLLAPVIHLPGSERKLPAKVVCEEDYSLFGELDEDISNAFQLLMVYQNKSNLLTFLKEIQPGRSVANREFLASDWRKEGYYFKFEPFSNVEQLQQPALIILGRQDSICGFEDQMKLLRKFNHASFAILDQAGHMIQIEQRETTISLVKDWLFRVDKHR
ncbi:alpha/beta fold hydrolase [Paenibacillus planticolens]|uniref:Alpha/beta hydrolase n=1 Tax=Paenibacillus planticolens TaxID=2654976 RepID=A0ABX1ZMA0_9BACL|nr:alpha/beta hydrolase [Paenibacillus planticolens]NOV01201.1 alpha/beta hydrolase [Paenibacillus planticolens]